MIEIEGKQYMQDAKGALIPLSMVKEIDLERDQLVHEIVARARGVRDLLADFKHRTFGDIGAFVELSAERYDAKVGGARGNVSLLSFDGRYKVQHAISDTIGFDEGLMAAKVLFDECAKIFVEGGRDEARVIINDAFQVDKEGKISTSRVLNLRRYNFEHPKWLAAMEALSDSIRVQCSKSYVRVYERVGETSEYRSIPLDVSGV